MRKKVNLDWDINITPEGLDKALEWLNRCMKGLGCMNRGVDRVIYTSTELERKRFLPYYNEFMARL